MIKIDKENGLIMKGRMAEVQAEAIIILSQLFKKNVELHGLELAEVIMTNLMTKAIVSDATWVDAKNLDEVLNYDESRS